ncbi:hypothetical protein NW762_014221 [Fusarium torreyae]|uniref:Heterokaryon incompatibility domain-containing protein n=1 Tax=Fusarium torreyae TaxID=1237075 RepID=A0A9W8RKM7_9HYPO|nr:hypothetical protein NW762_014221 [Fusarium torreyae]
MTGNLDDMKAGLALDDLPPAYLDAIALTRELGVRYIWIDALCIIQDSQVDWERECSSMADTYANAYLTIAAASSSSVTQHFLRPQLEPPAQYQQRVYNESVANRTGPVMVKARLTWATGSHWKWQNTADHQPLVEPLTQRGWTLQEKVLSTRLLSISAMEMAWTCKERIYCECGSRLNYQREFGQTPLSQISKPGDAFNFWHKVIENYSKRNLTQPGDKLPAISAIASIIQQRIGSDYVAGLWSDNIDLDLLWRRAGEAQTISSSYIAPSFSWASITGEVDYLCFRNGKLPYQRASKVLEISSVTGPDAPLGRVSTSSLIIEGPISAGRIEYQEQSEYAVAYVGNTRFWFRPDTILSTTVAVGLDGVSEMSVCRETPKDNKGDPTKSPEKSDVTQGSGDAQEQSSLPIRCWVLRLGAFALLDKQQQNDHEILVLGKSPSQSDAFERIGLASSRYSGEEGELFVQERIATMIIV